MDKLKQWIALTVLGVLAIGAVGWFLLVAPQRSEAAELQAQADAQVETNAGLQSQVEVLKAQAKDLPQEQAKLAAVAAKVPIDPALPTLLRSLRAAADETGVQFVSLTPSPAAAVTGAAAGAATATAPATATATASATETDGTATPAATAGPTLLGIPVVINVVGSYFEVQQFVAALESLPRALRVNNLTLAPGTDPTEPGTASGNGTDGSSLASVITGLVFLSSDVAPSAATATAGTTAAPVAAGVAAATTPTTPTPATSPAPVTAN